MRDVGTLLEALPYIREFHGKTVVIKYGGAAMEDPALREEFARDVVLLKYVGLNPIVVHGGGPDITAYMQRLGLPVEFVGGLRVSDESPSRSPRWCSSARSTPRSCCVSTATASPRSACAATTARSFASPVAPRPGDRTSASSDRIDHVDVNVLQHVATDYIPVIASVGADRDGNSYNVNADEAAGAVAGALGAYKVIFLTDVPGWLADPKDPDSLIGQASTAEIRSALGGAGGRHASQATGMRRRNRGRRLRRPHPRRTPRAFAPAGAVHRRRHRNQDRGIPVNPHTGAGRRPRSLACCLHATLPASLSSLVCGPMGTGF